METTHEVLFTCTFCGGTFTENLPVRVEPTRSIDGCGACTVRTLARAGTKMVYGAAEGRPKGAVYADRHLERGATYTIKRIMRWQHGANVALQETGDFTFNLRLFVPVGFQKGATDGRSVAE